MLFRSNPYILKRGAAAFGGVQTVATGVGAFGGPGGVVATNVGALPYSIPTGMLAMTATLETGLTFAQLLEEEFGRYRPIVRDACLEISKFHFVSVASREKKDCSWQVYWADGLNPDRFLNVGEAKTWPNS